MLSWHFFFCLFWERHCLKGFSLPILATSASGSFITHIGLLDLSEESGFWGMFNKKLPNWELPLGRLTSHFGCNCRWKHRHSLICSNCSEKQPHQRAFGQLFDCTDDGLQMLLAVITLRETDQTKTHSLCFNRRFGPMQSWEGWTALFEQMRQNTVTKRRHKTGSCRRLEG